MRTTRLTSLWFALLLLSGCSGTEPDAGTAAAAKSGAVYEPEISLKGVYRFGFEMSVIHLCGGSRNDCAATLTLDDAGCWVKFTERAATALERLAPSHFETDDFGEAWMEGSGRIAREPGAFGHLDSYACLVEFTDVRTFDDGPPYVFRPPPP